MELRRALKAQLNVEMAMWVSVGRRDQGPPDFQQLRERYNGRILFVIHDYKISDGIRFSPQELVEWQERGAVGLKFYPGWQRGVQVDHPANDPTFHKMAQIGMIGASVHVADPSGTWGRRTEWFPEPVEFWRQQHAWENVLRRHPKVVFVNAHMLWLCHSDEQLDYLRYMLTTYPNLHVDLATAPEFMHPVGRENLRAFMIEYADRILFGTDMGTKWFAPDLGGAAENFKSRVPNYQRYFDLLETDRVLPSGLKGEFKIKGLALPLDVLEKLYYKNAMRIYPHVRENLKKLGYPID
ncbi:MAG TPA: amidohydrolase family protein [Bryobacteraceae bacterium]|nr:amidohydrolase family protein [Bryobacteraceae bacterium]